MQRLNWALFVVAVLCLPAAGIGIVCGAEISHPRDVSDDRFLPESNGPAMRAGQRDLTRSSTSAPLTHVDVFISGQDGFHTYRIPAMERFTLQSAGEDRDRLLWTGSATPARKRLRILTSYDEGKTFTHERLISDEYAAYSDLAILKDQTVGVLWERGVERGYQFITFTRLNRAWIDGSSSSKESAGQ